MTYLRFAVIVTALLSAGEWLWVVAIRAGRPYPVEWMEGSVIAHTFQLLDGKPIYAPPSSEFIPTLYPPFGYWMQGAAMQVLGRGLPAARAVSTLSTIGIVILMVFVVYRRTASKLACIVVVGAFLDAYVACGSWYDQSRNDMLFLFLGLASLVIVTGPLSLRRMIAAAILGSAATWTRQHGVVFIGLGFLHLFHRSRRHGLLFAALAIGINAPAIALLDRATGGWFLRYTWTSLGQYPLRLDRLLPVLGKIAVNLWIPLLCAAIWLARAFNRRAIAPLLSIWTFALVIFILIAILSMIKEGGYINHLIPVLVFALLHGGFALGTLERQADRPFALGFILILIIAQYGTWPPPSKALFSPAVLAAQKQAVSEIAAFPGNVLVLDDPYYLRLAGKPMNIDGGSVAYLSFLELDLPSDLELKVAEEHYSAVFLSKPLERGMHDRERSARRLYELIDQHYELSRKTITDDDVMIYVLRVPRYLYLPRHTALAEKTPA